LTTPLQIVIPGEPKSERKRQRILRTKSGGSIIGSRTDEPDRADFKSRCALFAAQVVARPLSGPLCVTIIVQRERPKSAPKRPTKGCPWPDHWTQKPDCDNFAKIVGDALTGIVWLDDAQITDLMVLKRWGVPQVTVEVQQIVTETEAA